MKRTVRLVASLLPGIVVSGCTGTDVGNGFVDVDFVTYDSSSAAARSASTKVAPDGLVVAGAWVSVERIRLRDASDCDGGGETEFLGPFAVDMLEAGPQASLSDLRVAFVDYCRFELRWDVQDAQADGVPSDLVGASILIEGRRGDGTDFILRSTRGDELRLDARDGAFSISEDTSALFLAFDVQDLFDGVDVDSADVTGDVVRIEEGSNEDLLDAFDDNVVSAAKLFDDNDGDKELDPEERDDTDVLAD